MVLHFFLLFFFFFLPLLIAYNFKLQVRKEHSKIHQQDVVDVLDKQLLEGMGVLLTEEEQRKCEESVCFSLHRSIGGSFESDN